MRGHKSLWCPMRLLAGRILALTLKSVTGSQTWLMFWNHVNQLQNRIATQKFCYRGPKPQKCPKWWGEGAKGLLGQGRQRPLALVQKRVAPVQNRVLVVQKTLGRPLLFGSKRTKHLLHPLLTTLGTFEVSGPCSRTGHKNKQEILEKGREMGKSHVVFSRIYRWGRNHYILNSGELLKCM